ncbi:MAG: hypothetical protein WC682_02545 [Parcubacteria group bacterium]|jgi:hypothetical protein
MKKNPAQKIIEKIRKEKIVPQSRIFLNWKSYLFWLIWFFTLALGALFLSFVILNLLDIHLGVLHQLGLGKIFFIFFKTAPYLWITLVILTMISGFLAIRRTRRGYRYNIIFITGVGVLVISIFGVIIHVAKINRHLGERMFVENRSMTRNMAFPIEGRWQSPEDGMLGGEVIDVNEKIFNLRCFDDEIWEISYSDETEFKIREIKKGIMIAVIGEKMDKNKFRAFVILPPPFERKMPMR